MGGYAGSGFSSGGYWLSERWIADNDHNVSLYTGDVSYNDDISYAYVACRQGL